MRSVGLPTTFSWSIGLVVAGVSNFMDQALAWPGRRAQRALDQGQLEGVLGVVLAPASTARLPPWRPAACALGRLDAPGLVGHAAEGHRPSRPWLDDRATETRAKA
jgi:hypothetical protein